MPIYEYQCRKCEAHFEVVQKFSDKPLRKCTSCGGAVRKLISRSSFHLKGTGWYATDYAKPGSKPKEDGEKKEAKPAEKKKADASKSETPKKTKTPPLGEN